MIAVVLGCVCLEVKHDEWKTFERKWKWKLFWSVFGCVGRKKNKWRGQVFLPWPTKIFSSQNREKTVWEWIFSWWTKMPMCTWASSSCLYFFFLLLCAETLPCCLQVGMDFFFLGQVASFFLFFFFLFIFYPWVCLFFFNFSGQWRCPSFFFFFLLIF